ncbi:RNA polymerase sigma-70 factor, ECF subfamily [Nocardioides terrae]|uniref:RNA polymerase sigma-70 factor, ECF subfamily n=1 Tax=Nocardioides terrae TaxID=574651 RepID=A0A1I1DNH8_9ACTN|nr:sigma-70 family RNA polymerase sigma factor [Nocardioides terrae]SFB76431.1 RNA polymerase sigma-70 factor, ECF subfamily [Nocardioides terrae]
MSADDPTVAAAKRGDPDAWRELYRAHAGRLLVWLQRRPLADGAITADDLAAESWLTAASKAADFTGSSDDFAGWLFGIARHLEANARRRAGRRRTAPLAEVEPDPVAGPEPAYVAAEWVRSALAGLPERERDVVTCLDVIGLDVAGTARALGMSQVAVRVARHRGLKRLRGHLGVVAGTAG